MARIGRLTLTWITCLTLAAFDAHAEHLRYSGPLSCSAIAMEARRGLVLEEFASDSCTSRLADSTEALTVAPREVPLASPGEFSITPASESAPARSSSLHSAAVPIAAFALMEACTAGMLYAGAKQPKGGYYIGGVMYLGALIGPVLGGADGIDGEPYHTVSLMGLSAACVYVGYRAISREKHPPVDRTRMFQESFIGFNLAACVPGVMEWTLRALEGKR